MYTVHYYIINVLSVISSLVHTLPGVLCIYQEQPPSPSVLVMTTNQQTSPMESTLPLLLLLLLYPQGPPQGVRITERE